MFSSIKISQLKFFNFLTTKKTIDSVLLNFLGLQIFRYLLSKSIYFLLGFFYSEKKMQKYYKNGYLIIDKFLSQEKFLKINEEFITIIEKEKKGRNIYAKSDIEKNSSINYILFEFEDNNENKLLYPELYSLYKDTKINDYFRLAERKKKIMLCMRLERLITNDEFKNDSNSYWHVDTYHNTHKAWIYLTDVKKENGSFNYLKGSNRLSITRLIWEYYNSIKTSIDKDFMPFFTHKNLSKKLEENKKEFSCEKNSFLIANTHGFHRRGDSITGQIRDSVSFYTRENPYKFF
jgi:ectoine hydroxylase-related dioxygenase (phytanoyl-CoA dioxygenase family)